MTETNLWPSRPESEECPTNKGSASRQGRILHAHFDGKTLHIRRSNYLDFVEKNMDNIKLYLRWMMSEPIGDTMFKGKVKVSTDKDTTPSKA